MNINLKEISNQLSYKEFVIKELDNEIGFIQFKEVSDNNIHIVSILLNYNYRKQGIGRQIINKLKDTYDIISGESSPFAIGFWLKMGAIFDYYIDIKNDEFTNYLLNQGEFPHFIISK